MRKSNSVDRNSLPRSPNTEALIQKPIEKGMMFSNGMKQKAVNSKNSFLMKTEEQRARTAIDRGSHTATANSLLVGPINSFLFNNNNSTQQDIKFATEDVETPEKKDSLKRHQSQQSPHIGSDEQSGKSFAQFKPRPSVRDQRRYVIKVDIGSSQHKNLKRAQYINRLKEIYNKEIQYVTFDLMKIMMEFTMLQETVQKIKEEVQGHLQKELQTAIHLIDSTKENVSIEVKTFALDCPKIDDIKRELKEVFKYYEFKGLIKPTGNLLDHNDTQSASRYITEGESPELVSRTINALGLSGPMKLGEEISKSSIGGPLDHTISGLNGPNGASSQTSQFLFNEMHDREETGNKGVLEPSAAVPSEKRIFAESEEEEEDIDDGEEESEEEGIEEHKSADPNKQIDLKKVQDSEEEEEEEESGSDEESSGEQEEEEESAGIIIEATKKIEITQVENKPSQRIFRDSNSDEDIIKEENEIFHREKTKEVISLSNIPAEPVPDLMFNNFLESELNKIKSLFLNDQPFNSKVESANSSPQTKLARAFKSTAKNDSSSGLDRKGSKVNIHPPVMAKFKMSVASPASTSIPSSGINTRRAKSNSTVQGGKNESKERGTVVEQVKKQQTITGKGNTVVSSPNKLPEPNPSLSESQLMYKEMFEELLTKGRGSGGPSSIPIQYNGIQPSKPDHLNPQRKKSSFHTSPQHSQVPAILSRDNRKSIEGSVNRSQNQNIQLSGSSKPGQVSDRGINLVSKLNKAPSAAKNLPQYSPLFQQ